MRKTLSIAAVLALSTLVAGANAATLSVSFKYGYENIGIKFSQNPVTVKAGTFAATLTGGPQGYPTSFDTYCVDLGHDVAGPWDVNLMSTNLLTHGKGMAWLYNHFASSVTDLIHGAALQAAIWEVLVDNSSNLDNGQFQLTTTGQLRTLADGYLTAWHNAGPGQDEAIWFQSVTHPQGKNQDMIGPRQPTVPEPGAVSLLGGSLIGLSALLRRRRK